MSLKESVRIKMLQLFNEKKCLTIKTLEQHFNCSVTSIRRFLKEMGYWSSFTDNSKWYTLKTIPSFNKKGVWFYQDIGFSRHGNLTQTILHFINNSPQGISSKELSDFLQRPYHNLLNQMYINKEINRFNKSRGNIYLASDEKVKQKQMDRLEVQSIEFKHIHSLHPQAAIYVLVEYIKRPEASFEALSKTVMRKRKVFASKEAIEQLFASYDLKKILQ